MASGADGFRQADLSGSTGSVCPQSTNRADCAPSVGNSPLVLQGIGLNRGRKVAGPNVLQSVSPAKQSRISLTWGHEPYRFYT